MIPPWERRNRAPRERYRLLYLKIFKDIARIEHALVSSLVSFSYVRRRSAHHAGQAAEVTDPRDLYRTQLRRLGKRVGQQSLITGVSAIPYRITRSLIGSRASRRCWPGVNGRLGLGGPPAARRATGTSADVGSSLEGR
jgi:hypothetical protein